MDFDPVEDANDAFDLNQFVDNLGNSSEELREVNMPLPGENDREG